MTLVIAQHQLGICFFAAKTILAFSIAWSAAALYRSNAEANIPQNKLLFLIVATAALGYFLPNVLLSRKIAYRQREIFENFPERHRSDDSLRGSAV